MSAVHAGPGSAPQVGDGVIRDYLVSVEGGKTFRHWLRLRLVGTEPGGRGLLDGSARFAQARVRNARLPSGTKTAGALVPAAIAIAVGSPVGLIVVGGAKIMEKPAAGMRLKGEPSRLSTRLQSKLKSDFRIARFHKFVRLAERGLRIYR